MKINISLSFQVLEHKTSRIREQLFIFNGKDSQARKNLKPVVDAFLDGKYSVGWEEDQDGLHYYIFKGYKCIGNVSFDFWPTWSIKRIRKLFPPSTKFAIPHAQFLPEYQGKGLASGMYKLAMDRDIVFITMDQSKAAIKLWQSLSKKTGATIYHFDPETRTRLTEPTANSVKIMTKLPVRFEK